MEDEYGLFILPHVINEWWNVLSSHIVEFLAVANIVDIVKLKTGYANFVELKSAFEAAQENAERMGYVPANLRRRCHILHCE